MSVAGGRTSAVKQNLPVYPIGGVEAAGIVKKIYSYSPELLAKTAKASE